LKKILREGNTAQQWLKLHDSGLDTRSIILQGINGMVQQEWELEDNLCAQLVA
ncbi:MAG: putative glutamate--cysteine ligase, partial [Oscillatoriales cyanobacterium]